LRAAPLRAPRRAAAQGEGEGLQEHAKRESSKEKDFAAAAGKRRKAEEGIKEATARLEELAAEITALERRKVETPWYALFKQMEDRKRCTVSCLDLSDCGLHATGLVLLTNVLMELEQRPDSQPVTELVLDGNDVGDLGMAAVSSYLRMTKHLQCLRLRNVGVTDRGVSQVLSGLVTNKALRLLDLRSNGLASAEVSRAAVGGVQRFNKLAEVLLD